MCAAVAGALVMLGLKPGSFTGAPGPTAATTLWDIWESDRAIWTYCVSKGGGVLIKPTLPFNFELAEPQRYRDGRSIFRTQVQMLARNGFTPLTEAQFLARQASYMGDHAHTLGRVQS